MDAIDRIALVRRHNPVLTELDPASPLSVGNGEFAFTADVTGLQTFDDAYLKTTPLCTMSQWAWHRDPRPADLPPLRLTDYDAHGRSVGYATDSRGQEATFKYLRENPHRVDLGRIGFSLHTRDGRLAAPADLRDVRQELHLFAGFLETHFRIDDNVADVRTCCHPTRDAIAVDLYGPLLHNNFVSIVLRFPGPSPAVAAAEWDHPVRHATVPMQSDARSARFERRLHDDHYYVSLAWSDGTLQRRNDHEWELVPRPGSDRFWLWCEFAPTAEKLAEPLDADATFAATGRHWQDFWMTGGAVELSASKDPRWKELERRIVLSQYLTAINCAGSLPPAETGLTCNSWYGKFHLEM